MSEKHDADKNVPSRRTMIKRAASGAAASAFLLPGMAAANDSSGFEDKQGDTKEPGRTSPQIRKRKASAEGEKWNEAWLDSSQVDENWVAETDTEDISAIAANGRHLHGEYGVKGIKLVVDAYLGNCKGHLKLKALGQSNRTSFNCNGRNCKSVHLDAGAAYLNYTSCVNWKKKKLRLKTKGCIWHINGWSCASPTFRLG